MPKSMKPNSEPEIVTRRSITIPCNQTSGIRNNNF